MLQVDDYIMKPVDAGEFAEILKKLTMKADSKKVQEEESALQKMIQEGIGTEENGFPGRYMLSLVRVGLFQQYAAPLSKELVKEIMAE